MKVVVCPGDGPGGVAAQGPLGRAAAQVTGAVAHRLSRALGRRLVTAEILPLDSPADAEASRQAISHLAEAPYEVDLLLILRCAVNPDPTAWGTRCLYLAGSEDGRLLAEGIARRFPRPEWATVEGVDSPLLAAAACPAVIVEIDHVSNPEVEMLMGETSWQDKVADNLVDGLLAYIGPQDIRVVVDGLEIIVEPAPQEIYNDVLIPIKALAAALHTDVHWDPRRRLLTLRSRTPR